MRTSVLVTGSNGQLGKTIKELFINNIDNIEFTFASKKDLDITNSEAVDLLFSKKTFQYCINCAAFTNVEMAEEEQIQAYKKNAESVAHLSNVCNQYNTTLIHISTDYIFDGKKGEPYLEDDIPNPINSYGLSKLKGEQFIKEILSNYFIIRTSWLYSEYGNNFFKTVLNKIKQKEDIKVTISETGSPTACSDLAVFIYQLIVKKSQKFGTYHYSNSGETTWYKFALEIVKKFESKN